MITDNIKQIQIPGLNNVELMLSSKIIKQVKNGIFRTCNAKINRILMMLSKGPGHTCKQIKQDKAEQASDPVYKVLPLLQRILLTLSDEKILYLVQM